GMVLADTLSDLKKPLREAYERIRALGESGGGTVSRREIREALGLPDSTVRGWLTQLLELDYIDIETSKGGAGRSTRYRANDRGPRQDVTAGLLSPDELGKKCRSKHAKPRRNPWRHYVSGALPNGSAPPDHPRNRPLEPSAPQPARRARLRVP